MSILWNFSIAGSPRRMDIPWLQTSTLASNLRDQIPGLAKSRRRLLLELLREWFKVKIVFGGRTGHREWPGNQIFPAIGHGSIIDERVGKKIYTRNKEAYWEGCAWAITHFTRRFTIQKMQLHKVVLTHFCCQENLYREATIKEEGVCAYDQGSAQQTSNSGQKTNVKNTLSWPSQLRNRSSHLESPGILGKGLFQ